MNYDAYQFLISKGYDVPLFFEANHWANGKTAVELGIAVNAKLSEQKVEEGTESVVREKHCI